jgi:hypothetical protein
MRGGRTGTRGPGGPGWHQGGRQRRRHGAIAPWPLSRRRSPRSCARLPRSTGARPLRKLLGVDLATIRKAAANVEPYLRADGTKIWSLVQLERQLGPEAFGARRPGGNITVGAPTAGTSAPMADRGAPR